MIKRSTLALGIALLAAPASAATCPIDRSIYRDGDEKGFELVFSLPVPETPTYATVTIRHPQQEQLYYFSVTQSNGYGTIALLRLDETGERLENTKTFGLNFFNADYRSATPRPLERETPAPELASIWGLGSYDFYQRKGRVSSETPPFLGDVMWIYDRCQ